MKYQTIVADPPWPYEDQPWGVSSLAPGRSFLPYRTMDLEDIAAIPVKEWAARRGAHLYLWTTQKFLRDAYWITEAWGFNPVCLLAWCKPTMPNAPGTFRSSLEFAIFARRGNLPALRRVESQWFQWPRGEHSRKPEAFLDLVEQVSPGPYLELFARRQRLGWDTWGDEAFDHVQAGSA